MSEAKSSESGSDLSSNSSWTLIEEKVVESSSQVPGEPVEETPDSVVIHASSEIKALNANSNTIESEADISDTTSVSSLSSVSDHTGKTQTKENGFLTFDEYLQERLIEYDFENDPKPAEIKSKIDEKTHKARKKCKAETIHILTMMCSMLVLTGLTLLCVLFPQRIDHKVNSAVQRNYVAAVVANDRLNPENLVGNLNRTSEVINMVANSNAFDKIKSSMESRYLINTGPQKDPTQQTNKPASVSGINFTKPTDNKNPNEDKVHVYAKQCNAKDTFDPVHNATKSKADTTQDKSSKVERNTNNKHQTSRLSAFKEFLSKTNLLTIISCVMHNICVLKMVKHIYKKQDVGADDEDTMSQVDQKVDGQSPTAAGTSQQQGNTRIGGAKFSTNTTVGKKSSEKLMPLKPLLEGLPININSSAMQGGAAGNGADANLQPLSGKSLFSLQTSENLFTFKPPDTVPTYNPTNQELLDRLHLSFAFARCSKRKCDGERRLNNLDKHKKRLDIFGDKQRRKIKLLKGELKQDISDAREKEVELSARSKRISAIRENFILKLKQHREKYLTELKSLKQERQVLLKELCSKKYASSVDFRDASVGNYVVPLTGTCDFQEKLELIKQKQFSHKSDARISFSAQKPSAETTALNSKLCSYKSSPCVKVNRFEEEKLMSFSPVVDTDAKKQCSSSTKQKRRLQEIKERYMRKQTQILDEYHKVMGKSVLKAGNSSRSSFVEPCISLLDEIILEAVDMVHKKSRYSVEPTRILIKKRLVSKRSDPSKVNMNRLDEASSRSFHGKPKKHGTSLNSRLDLYTALFDKDADRIRMREEALRKLKSERLEPTTAPKNLSKQDPQKGYVERVLRGHY